MTGQNEDSSVKVAVRIRPQNPREKLQLCSICTRVTPGEPQVTLSQTSYTYDYVYDLDKLQPIIYDSCVSKLIEGCFGGYNATILAYGQTGSGKTYTMGTGFDLTLTPEENGIIPRAVDCLFEGLSELSQGTEGKSREFQVTAQFVELHNDDLIDLLDPMSKVGGKKGLRIQEDPSGDINIVGVSHRLVRNSLEEGTEPMELEHLSAKLHFVDLAGSERLKRTGATGERAKEGININIGLLALGNVISALADKKKKSQHVPYRDSKLTRLLQDSLGGNSRTLMIACVSPSDCDFVETLNTLKYANRARNITNKVVVNQDRTSQIITQLRVEIDTLKLELADFKQGKRLVNTDGTESYNDTYHENLMLQTEVNQLRVRVKALLETMNALQAKNAALATQRDLASAAGESTDVAEIIRGYIDQIEDLNTKLCESEATCQVMRRQIDRLTGGAGRHPPAGVFVSPAPPTPAMSRIASAPGGNISAMSASPYSAMDMDTSKILDIAKADVARLRMIQSTDEITEEETEKMETSTEDDVDDADEDDSDDDDNEDEQTELEKGVIDLNREIQIKENLIKELERAKEQQVAMREHYELKLKQLQERITETEHERDRVLASMNNQGTEVEAEKRRIKHVYEKKLSDMNVQVEKLQSAQREHNRLTRQQQKHEARIRQYERDISDMKRAKVQLMQKLQEEAKANKEATARHRKQAAQAAKDARQKDVQIRQLEAEKQRQNVVFQRKQEELQLLRKRNRDAPSQTPTKTVVSRSSAKAAAPRSHFSPRLAKRRWVILEHQISRAVSSGQVLGQMEAELQRWLDKREYLNRELSTTRGQVAELERSLVKLDTSDQSEARSAIAALRDQVASYDDNLVYVKEGMDECQKNILRVEESKPTDTATDADALIEKLSNMEEAKYLLKHLYSYGVSQGLAASQMDSTVKELDAKLQQSQHETRVQQQLLKHCFDYNPDAFGLQNSEAMTSSADSSGLPDISQSTASLISRCVAAQKDHKARRRTATTEELLYVDDAPQGSRLPTVVENGQRTRETSPEHPTQDSKSTTPDSGVNSEGR